MKTDNPTLRRQVVGEQLRVLRRQACLTLHEVGRAINCSDSKLCRIESGQRSASLEDIAILLGLYRADPAQRSHVLALARDADELDWRQPKGPTMFCQNTLRSLQSQADQIVSFDPVVIPRLLQTNEYRSAVLAASVITPTSGVNHDGQAMSAHRQPPTLLAFVEERVLHRPMGSPEILGHQLEHLRETAVDSDSTIRVIPKENAVAACGPFSLLRMPDRTPVVVLELLTCRLFLERQEAIDTYERALKYLDNNALSEAESLKLISSAAAEIDT